MIMVWLNDIGFFLIYDQNGIVTTMGLWDTFPKKNSVEILLRVRCNYIQVQIAVFYESRTVGQNL